MGKLQLIKIRKRGKIVRVNRKAVNKYGKEQFFAVWLTTRRKEVFCPQEVDSNQGGDAGYVNGERDPPKDFFPLLFLKIAEDIDTHQETGNGSGEMSSVAYIRVYSFDVMIINICPDVHANKNKDE